MADGTISVFEFMLKKALTRHVLLARRPARNDRPQIFDLGAITRETGLILSILASAAGEARGLQVAAFAAGVSQRRSSPTGSPSARRTPGISRSSMPPSRNRHGRRPHQTAAALRRRARRQPGWSHPAAEAELLRAVSDALGCPMAAADRRGMKSRHHAIGRCDGGHQVYRLAGPVSDVLRCGPAHRAA